jgi:hypothetical protein
MSSTSLASFRRHDYLDGLLARRLAPVVAAAVHRHPHGLDGLTRSARPDLSATPPESGIFIMTDSFEEKCRRADERTARERRCPYEVLGVARDASFEQVKKAYYTLVKKWHPDRHPPTDKDQCTQRIIETNAAYEILKDPEQREAYDKYGFGARGLGAAKHQRKGAALIGRKFSPRCSRRLSIGSSSLPARMPTSSTPRTRSLMRTPRSAATGKPTTCAAVLSRCGCARSSSASTRRASTPT